MPCGSMPILNQKKTFDKIFNKDNFIYSPKGELVQKRNALASITNYCKTNNIELIADNTIIGTLK